MTHERLAMGLGEAWRNDVVLADGTAVTIRPLSPAHDREREVEFLMGLSERTRYMRLFAPLRYLPPHVLDQFMDVDGERRAALVGIVTQDALERFIGVARYAVTDDPDSAEIGITVTDAWQRRGIASLLLETLMDYARARGIKTFTGYVLPENGSMLNLARRLGFELHLAMPEQLMKIAKRL